MPQRFVAFDVETTGLFPESDRLTEIAGFSFTLDGQVTGRFEEFCNPGIPVPQEVVEITGIKDEMLVHAPPPLDVVERFFEFCEGAVLVAHNALFDGSFLAAELERQKRPVPVYTLLDTLNWSRSRLKLKDFRLQTVARYFHLRPKGSHRAAEDALTAMGVFLNLCKLAKATTPEAAMAAGGPFPLADCLAGAVKLPEHLAELPRLIEAQARVTIEYLGGSQGALPRPVTPRGLIRMGQAAYLVAYCHRDKKEKQFRLDRIRNMREVRELPRRKRAGRSLRDRSGEEPAPRAARTRR